MAINLDTDTGYKMNKGAHQSHVFVHPIYPARRFVQDVSIWGVTMVVRPSLFHHYSTTSVGGFFGVRKSFHCGAMSEPYCRARDKAEAELQPQPCRVRAYTSSSQQADALRQLICPPRDLAL
ncbi:hypothetical protein HYDPIDRAFT_111453, partial [Hydnomerulius pinastri MD-312]